MYATAGEHLTQRMRKLTFEAMLRQEMGWFDDPANSTGALCSRLSGDAGALQGVSFTADLFAIPIFGFFEGKLRLTYFIS